MEKPSLYALLGGVARLDRSSGDRINERRTLRTLSAYFDVFYNNEKFDTLKPILGTKKLGPSRQYDYYYIRNNPKVFSSIRGKKLSFAYPYQEDIFERSTALVVPTANWKRHLLRLGHDSEKKIAFVYDGILPKIEIPIIHIGQTIDEALLERSFDSRRDFYLRVRTTNSKKIFGYYGNLKKDLYPYRAFSAIERIYGENRSVDPMIALAGTFRKDSEISYRNSVFIGQIPYRDMASLHQITLANLTNESYLNHCLGNQKIIDSISFGAPVLCQRLDTYVEQLGEEYPCFYDTEDEAYDLASRLIIDEDFRKMVSEMALRRAERFRPESVQESFIAQPELKLLSGS